MGLLTVSPIVGQVDGLDGPGRVSPEGDQR